MQICYIPIPNYPQKRFKIEEQNCKCRGNIYFYT